MGGEVLTGQANAPPTAPLKAATKDLAQGVKHWLMRELFAPAPPDLEAVNAQIPRLPG